MPSGAVVGIDTNLDCQVDANVVMSGPVQVQRSHSLDDSNNYPGTRPVDGHRDAIDTEIISMSLAGSGYTLVAGVGRGDIALGASKGCIAEQPGNPNVADSFFDVFFEVSNGSNHLYNQTPLRISAGIICVPPGSNYEHFQGCIPLYTSPIPGQGVHVANLVTANHQPFPGGTDAVPMQAPATSPMLYGNMPNPVVDQTTIRFSIPSVGQATLEIYSATGAVVRSMASEGTSAGERSFVWDRKDQNGRQVPAGVYQYVIRAGDRRLMGKMTVIH
jgi:hypothetical protein